MERSTPPRSANSEQYYSSLEDSSPRVVRMEPNPPEAEELWARQTEHLHRPPPPISTPRQRSEFATNVNLYTSPSPSLPPPPPSPSLFEFNFSFPPPLASRLSEQERARTERLKVLKMEAELKGVKTTGRRWRRQKGGERGGALGVLKRAASKVKGSLRGKGWMGMGGSVGEVEAGRLSSAGEEEGAAATPRPRSRGQLRPFDLSPAPAEDSPATLHIRLPSPPTFPRKVPRKSAGSIRKVINRGRPIPRRAETQGVTGLRSPAPRLPRTPARALNFARPSYASFDGWEWEHEPSGFSVDSALDEEVGDEGGSPLESTSGGEDEAEDLICRVPKVMVESDSEEEVAEVRPLRLGPRPAQSASKENDSPTPSHRPTARLGSRAYFAITNDSPLTTLLRSLEIAQSRVASSPNIETSASENITTRRPRSPASSPISTTTEELMLGDESHSSGDSSAELLDTPSGPSLSRLTPPPRTTSADPITPPQLPVITPLGLSSANRKRNSPLPWPLPPPPTLTPRRSTAELTSFTACATPADSLSSRYATSTPIQRSESILSLLRVYHADSTPVSDRRPTLDGGSSGSSGRSLLRRSSSSFGKRGAAMGGWKGDVSVEGPTRVRAEGLFARPWEL